MGQRAINLFHEQKINVLVGAPLEGAREILEKFLAGKLELSANCCDH
jgi:predicted Fe-Mo cluster-binding NifX family protein